MLFAVFNAQFPVSKIFSLSRSKPRKTLFATPSMQSSSSFWISFLTASVYPKRQTSQIWLNTSDLNSSFGLNFCRNTKLSTFSALIVNFFKFALVAFLGCFFSCFHCNLFSWLLYPFFYAIIDPSQPNKSL